MTDGPLPTVSLFEIPLAVARMPEVLDLCEQRIRTRDPLLIGVVNAAKIVNMRRNPQLRESVLDADVIFADGQSVVWASKVLRRPLPERIAGIDIMTGLFSRANDNQYRIFLLGATQEILDRTIERLQREHPNAIVAGAHHGYFDKAGEETVANQIEAANADMIFVAMTSPKKEEFLARWSEKIRVPICHGVGGSFDVYAGKVKRAPRVWQKLGLEWFYRMMQEPRRLAGRYFSTNSRFVWMVIREALQPRAATRS